MAFTSSYTNPDTIIQQNVNNLVGSASNSITKNIKNPVLAGAAQSLVQNLLGNILGSSQSNSGVFQQPTNQTISSISNISSVFSRLDGNYEFSKSCRFLVNIPTPPCVVNKSGNLNLNQTNLQFACHTAELPGVNVHPIEFRHNSFIQRVPHMPTFDPITLSFYCFGDMIERNFFEFWMNQMVDFQSGLLNYPRDDNNTPYNMTDITIAQYAVDNTQNYLVKLFDAFPISINSMGLNWGEDRIQELQVTFAYTKWRTYVTDSSPTQPKYSNSQSNNTVPSPNSEELNYSI